MGHCIEHYTYDINQSKEHICKELQEYVEHETYREGGSLGNIRFLDIVCDDYDDAKKYIASIDRGWYDNIAVKYRTYKDITSAKLVALQKQLSETNHKLLYSKQTVPFKDFKAAYIGCKGCGSKINKDYIKRNTCPICSHDLRSETIIQKEKSLERKVSELCGKIDAETKHLQKKAVSKSKLNWLVKIEYHI